MFKPFHRLACSAKAVTLVLSGIVALGGAIRSGMGEERAKKTTASPALPAKQAGESATSSKPGAAADGTSKLTRAKYDSVHLGMKEDEVTAILGPANGYRMFDETLAGEKYHVKYLYWKHAKSTL